ncbi:MAG: hypothetical protein Q8S57_07030 [Methanoregula sp.]|nr:hypothetical protein [Methanoregula sp.]
MIVVVGIIGCFVTTETTGDITDVVGVATGAELVDPVLVHPHINKNPIIRIINIPVIRQFFIFPPFI